MLSELPTSKLPEVESLIHSRSHIQCWKLDVGSWTFIFVLLLLIWICLPASAEDMVTLTGDSWHWSPDDKIRIEGNVTATYRDFTISADSVDADLQTNMAVFNGVVKLSTKDHVVEGHHLSLNMKTRDWNVDDANTQLQLSTLDGKPTVEGFIHSSGMTGDEKEIEVNSASFTTCNLDHPHYLISARRIDIYPGSRVVAHDASMIALGRRLFTVPTMVIPIRGTQYNIIPSVGSSVDEGMFIKLAYAYTATRSNTGYLKLDMMQKRGVGLGADDSYKLRTGSGQASIYYLQDQQLGGTNLTGSVKHDQKIGSINLDINAGYRANDYLYFPSTTSENWQAALSQITTRASTSLMFRGTGNHGSFNSDTSNASLRDTRQFSKDFSGLFSLDMNSLSSTGMSAADRELNSSVQFNERADKYDLSLMASKRFDLDGNRFTGDNLFSNLDRLPELTLSTDTYRLGKSPMLGLPFRLSVSAGRYHEMPGDITGNRLLFQWDMLSHTVNFGDKTDLNLTAGYRQAYYASDEMQYVLKSYDVLTTRFNDYLKTRLTYNTQNVDGFSPFLFDYTGKYNYTRFVTDYQDSSRLRWSIASGYDFRLHNSPWQDLTFRMTDHLSPRYAFSVATGYDLNKSKWRNLINQFQIADPNHLSLNLGTRYDLLGGGLNALRALADWKINRLWRFQGITSYNGITKKFDYSSLRLTRDLHCWEVSLSYDDETGFRNVRGFSLDLHIKGFAPPDRFGIGQFGQTVDTSMGQYFY